MAETKIFDRTIQSVHSPIDTTLILKMRWLAICGQLAALLYTAFGLGFDVPVGPVLIIISLSVVVNIWQTRRNLITHVKSDQNFLALIFDIMQLSAALFFTGGLLNPFASLFLAPVVVSAAILRPKEIFALIALVAANISFLALYHYPLPWGEDALILPDLYQSGLWMALVLAVFFNGGYVWSVASRSRRLAEALSEAQMIMADEQQSVALGTLATAAAHELGSPLNTITLISHELAKEITVDDPIYDDVQLLRSEVERCRVILASLDELRMVGHLELETPVPLNEVINTIISDRIDASMVEFRVKVADGRASPRAKQRPELIQALQSILSNANTFAVSFVDVTIRTIADDVTIYVTDDGPGFSSGVLSRAGQPWNSSRFGQLGHRGLGIYIARTLIEGLGGSILFKNSKSGSGVVTITLPLSALTGEGLVS